jgi:serine O-acetyltransferase
MDSKREYIIFILNCIRCIPHVLVYYLHKNKSLIKEDIKNGLKLLNKNYGNLKGLIYLLSFEKAFRNLFYYRVQPFEIILNIVCPRLIAMRIDACKIGPGLSISHGFGSTIGAKSIGKNCTIFQQVTLGAAGNAGFPTILDNVTIYAGAVIIGNVTIGNNSVVGANATVFRDIPDNCTVLPGTSKIMKWRIKQ